MSNNLCKYIHKKWSLWIFVIVILNIIVFMNFVRNQSSGSSVSSAERSFQMLDGKIQRLVEEAHNEINEHKNFMKNIMNLLEKVSNENNNEVTSEKSFLKLNEKRPGYCLNNVIAVLIITCNRSSGLERTLKQLIKYRSQLDSNISQFPIYISQGCNDNPTKQIVEKYKKNISGTLFYHQQDDILMKKVKVKRMFGYFKISDHYRNAIDWALGIGNQTYEYELYSNVKLNELESLLIVEDDLDIAPDFFSYFRATNFILRNDKNLFCVSAWNDNGKKNLVNQSANEQLYRTDFFPGLGWMMLRSFWLEIRGKWPDSFWDEYLRQPEIRKNRQCIRPEIPRTATFGRKGVSNGQFFDKHLKFLLLNDKPVDFCQANLSYIMSQSVYDSMWLKQVYHDSVELSLAKFVSSKPETLPKYIRIEYSVNKQFSEYAKKLSLMEDVKSGVPRTAYRGVVTFMRDNLRVFLSPHKNWTEYNLS